jgi:hypothetical protein
MTKQCKNSFGQSTQLYENCKFRSQNILQYWGPNKVQVKKYHLSRSGNSFSYMLRISTHNKGFQCGIDLLLFSS